MRLGVFGGTFDPPHLAHLIVAQDALEALTLDRVLFVPAATPPHKREREVTEPGIRLAMLRAALGDDARFEIDERELRRGGASYTVDTLRELREARTDAELVLLIGVDQWREFATWREPAEIRRLAEIAVLTRPAAAPDVSPAPHPQPQPQPQPDSQVAVTPLDISSTEIRARVRDGRSIRYLVPAGVAALIRRGGLYRW